jgi:histidinol-phosphate aminotransferase
MSKFWSPIVEKLEPYTPGEQPAHQKFIKLNTNENPYGPSPLAIDAILAATDDGLRLTRIPLPPISSTPSPQRSSST